MTEPKRGHRHQGAREFRPNAVKRRALLHLLHSCHRGMGRSITFADLAVAVRMNERTCREYVEAIRRECDPRHRIGTLPFPPYGVFVVETEEEWELVSRVNWSRVGEMAATATAFDQACREWFHPSRAMQVSLGFEEAM